jgi:cell division protease FtsH
MPGKLTTVPDAGRSKMGFLRPLAVLAAGRSGADIERLVREARQRARRAGRPIAWSDLEGALRGDIQPLPEELRWRLAIHEAGHAMAYTILGTGDVETIAIGTERGGHVSVHINHTVCQDETWLMNIIACNLAGRTAETLIFGSALIGSGGSDDSDLANATKNAIAAETSLGLSIEAPLLYRPPTSTFNALLHDPDLAERVKARLTQAEQIALGLLKRNLLLLTTLAKAITEAGVVDGGTVRKILASATSDPD